MSDQSADAFMEWTAGIRKMLIEAGEKTAAARVDNYSFETFEAGWQASRRAAMEECWEAVHGERLEDPTETHGDMAYERAVEDCENAIRALAGTET